MFEAFFDGKALDFADLSLGVGTADAVADTTPVAGLATSPDADPFDAATDNATCAICDFPETDDSEAVVVMVGFSLNDIDVFA